MQRRIHLLKQTGTRTAFGKIQLGTLYRFVADVPEQYSTSNGGREARCDEANIKCDGFLYVNK